MRINLSSILLDLLFVKHLTSQQPYLRALRFLLDQRLNFREDTLQTLHVSLHLRKRASPVPLKRLLRCNIISMILQLRVQFFKEAFEGLDLLQKAFHVLRSILELSPEIMDLLRARSDKADHGDEAGRERDRFHGGHADCKRLSLVERSMDIGVSKHDVEYLV